MPVDLVEIRFTETAGAGTYTGRVHLPPSTLVLDVLVDTTASFAATTALLDVGDTEDGDHYIADLDVKTQGQTALTENGAVNTLGAESPAWTRYPDGENIVATLVTTGSGGTTGRLIVTVIYTENRRGTARPTKA